MKPHEAAYLWARAKMIDDRVLAAAAKGEAYRPVAGFMPIDDQRFLAHALFQRGPTPRLVLRLTWDPAVEVALDALDRAAAVFYGGRKFFALPPVVVTEPGGLPHRERAYYCEDLPWPTSSSP